MWLMTNEPAELMQTVDEYWAERALNELAARGQATLDEAGQTVDEYWAEKQASAIEAGRIIAGNRPRPDGQGGRDNVYWHLWSPGFGVVTYIRGWETDMIDMAYMMNFLIKRGSSYFIDTTVVGVLEQAKAYHPEAF